MLYVRRKSVFSYAAEDFDIAEKLYEYYREREYDIFVAKISLSPGVPYESAIIKEISNRDIFIAIITREALELPPKTWIDREFQEARRLGKKIIPCKHHKVTLKQMEAIKGLRQMHYIEFTNVHDLIRNIREPFEEAVNKIDEERIFGEKPQQPFSLEDNIFLRLRKSSLCQRCGHDLLSHRGHSFADLEEWHCEQCDCKGFLYHAF